MQTTYITRTYNTQYADPLLFIPGEAGSRNLMPSYKRLAASIRQVSERPSVHPCLGTRVVASVMVGGWLL